MLDLAPFIRGRSGAAIFVAFFGGTNFFLSVKVSTWLGDWPLSRRNVLSLLPSREFRLRRYFL